MLAEGRRLAKQYRLLIEPDSEVGYVGSAVEMPMVFGEGTTTNACIEDTLDALANTIAVMLALGERPPSSASEDRREVQVNIRLTAKEKIIIDELARRAGFRSISDYLRTSGLRQAS
jgi:predicted RNase H-like HicB family nuclease